jgi:beta-1,4-N-acetylglucosaminyltransferase
LKICLACSQGGHFVQMMQLLEAFEGHESFFVSYNSEATKYLKNVYLLKYEKDYIKDKLNLIRTIIKAIYILLKEKPDLVISTGGGEIAVPFCYIGKILGANVIFIETLARVTTCSGGGKLVYPIADLFLVQWKSLLNKYGKKTKYWGQIF